MANVKLKKKKYDGGYEQLYPHTLAKNVMTGTGNVDTDIIMLRQRIVNLEYTKTPIVIEVEERSSDGSTQAYEALGINAWHFQNTEANLKIVFNETNRGGNIVIDATDDMGMTMNYPILAGLYDRKFEDGEIKPGKIYSLLYYNYQFYLIDSDSDDLEKIKEDIRKTEIAYTIGAKYGGEFGINLRSIEANKVYYYFDTSKKDYIPYLARVTKTGTFITPDVENFIGISIRENLFYKKLAIAVSDYGGLRITDAYIVNGMIKIFGYAFDPTSLNALPLGSGIANLTTMIPELKNYGAYGTIVPGINLTVGTDFTIIKSYSSIAFQSQHNFCIETGVYKGTIR